MHVILEDNDPLIIDNKRQGYIIDKSGSCHIFDNILYYEEYNPEWPDSDPPYYYLISYSEMLEQLHTMGISVSNVQFIVFDRIRGLEEN